MFRNAVLTLSISLFCLLAGCSPHAQTPYVKGETASETAPPVPPQGMRLGNAYISALNEQCYELIPLHMRFEAARAMCLRGKEWEVLPPVLTNLPDNSAAR